MYNRFYGYQNAALAFKGALKLLKYQYTINNTMDKNTHKSVKLKLLKLLTVTTSSQHAGQTIQPVY